MISNLQSARALILADLNHARKVLDLWAHQVHVLEKALEQIDTVGNSRKALSEEYKGGRNGAPRLMAAEATGIAKKGRKRKEGSVTASTGKKRTARVHEDKTSDAGSESVQEAKAGKGKKANTGMSRSRKTSRVAAKYKDPLSDKTWSGRGRRPAWFTGAPEQYLISSSSTQHEAGNTSSTVH
ncbi:H-NS histone family protein [Noviherbaspirillum pedocola]|uniref:H-NS histone family protein n=1 Tax=Noviherbaspirillum pedocola TaxID=2801341 RepID=A0A934T0K7_9BURK|nr:H-NS family nucleoid-associated regulatory protein [Noviherbaspirillum pedocola]MBK4738486.1 H-NS histone family protein [Noviherbaspirillum pedocola]